MRQVALQMGMSLDGYVASDREHPGASVAEDAELVRWKGIARWADKAPAGRREIEHGVHADHRIPHQ